ncbi:M23 family metallopeptidase [Pseudomarimonas arenosa]|uniref:Peptidoglycan DD-metalloendopeptidase family protein n=1 Tax=Pseudomarimonas arenosa TaxID=2774145 RepID=A0AAW3ZN33_9GAMM|nr:peptidoglycan DD-metalloendopeptidase family protein [Pseudomarimonas arenosa]MBD8526910.1 peptidoglycan DD-metalloendopeptidase family protein [Pseudomarimonas arenosa]
MRIAPLLGLLALLSVDGPLARPPEGGGGVEAAHDEIPLMVAQKYALQVEQAARQLAKRGIDPLRLAPKIDGLDWPLRARGSFPDNDYWGVSNFVDLNPTIGVVQDYNCGTRSYDLSSGYNHAGIDYFLWPFSWRMMDAEQIEVVAAAPGTILYKSDGNDDRSCPNNYSDDWNAVYIQHGDGTVMWYGHLKTGSLTSAPVGSQVQTGAYLGLVGSSGFSTGPHLHMELRSSASGGATIIEPHAGSCRAGLSNWAAQRPYRSTRINRVAAHDAVPSFNVSCPNPGQEPDTFASSFEPGQQAYFAIYLRDQTNALPATIRIRRPDGSDFQNFNTNLNGEFNASYWYWSYILPANAMVGTWSFEVTAAGETVSTFFTVGASVFADGFEG